MGRKERPKGKKILKWYISKKISFGVAFFELPFLEWHILKWRVSEWQSQILPRVKGTPLTPHKHTHTPAHPRSHGWIFGIPTAELNFRSSYSYCFSLSSINM